MRSLKKISRMNEHAVPSAKRTNMGYQVMDNIDYKEDQCHSMFRDLPKLNEEADMLGESLTGREWQCQLTLDRQRLIGKHIVSMLNSSGGILAFGVHNNGVILGVKLTKGEEDLLKCTIDETMKGISPCVRCNQYLVKFTPVKSQFFMDDSQHKRHVLEIKVTAGDPYELYEDQDHEAFSRDGTSIVGPLTPHQIKGITIEKLSKRITIEKLNKKIRFEKELADFFSPLYPSPRLCKALSHVNSLHGVGHMLFAWKAINMRSKIRKDKSYKSGVTSRSSLVTVVKKAIEKVVVSKEVVMCSMNSKDYSAEEAQSEGAQSEKTRSSKVWVEKACSSKDDVETMLSRDLIEETVSVSSTVEVWSSKGPVASSSSAIDEMLAQPVLCKAQKGGDQENVSPTITKSCFNRDVGFQDMMEEAGHKSRPVFLDEKMTMI